MAAPSQSPTSSLVALVDEIAARAAESAVERLMERVEALRAPDPRIEALPLVLTPREAAKVLGVSDEVIYESIRRGQVPSVRLGERRVLVPRDRLLRWLETGEDPVAG